MFLIVPPNRILQSIQKLMESNNVNFAIIINISMIMKIKGDAMIYVQMDFLGILQAKNVYSVMKYHKLQE